MEADTKTPTLRILLIDAHEQTALAFRQALKHSSIIYKVTQQTKASTILEQPDFDITLFDIIIIDGHLLDMPGIDLCQELLSRRLRLPLVILIEVGQEELVEKALHIGVADYILKDTDRGYLRLLPVMLPRIIKQHNDRLVCQRLETALHQASRELALLNRLGQELSATLDLQKVIAQLLYAVTETLDAEGASLWLWNDDAETQGRQLVCQGFCNLAQSCLLDVDLVLAPGQGVAGWVAQHGESTVIEHAHKDPRFFSGVDELTGLETQSLLAVPMNGREGVIGVLEVVNKRHGEFSDDLTLIKTLAASTSIILENASLVEELRHRTEELQIRNEELDAFARTSAHDLKNPLARIVGFAEAVEQQLDILSEEKLRYYLQLISKNGRKMSSIIDELLFWARVPKEEIKLQTLDMQAIVEDSLSRFTETIESRQATIILPEMWPESLGYGPWIEEVWANYLSNALKYGGRPEQGVPPRIELGFCSAGNCKAETGTPLIHQIPELQKNQALFWVCDNGIGLTRAEQARLFKPFERLGHPHETGHGLGLSIVQRIIEKLGGTVSVASELGTGSCFWFTLPSVPQ